MKKLLYLSLVAMLGLLLACGGSSSKECSSEDVATEVAASDSTAKTGKCCAGTKPDCPSKSDSTHTHEHEHVDGESHEHEHDHSDGEGHDHDH